MYMHMFGAMEHIEMYRAEKLLYGCIWMHIIVVAIIVID